MLMNHPAEFDKQARDWSVKYAGAHKSLLLKGISQPSTASSGKPKAQKTKEQELKEQLAKYVVKSTVLVNTRLTLT
jgi:hypothetical protein